LRILHPERRPDEIVDKVDFRTLHETERDRIDHHCRPVLLDRNVVVVSRIIELEILMEA
jgi:hypothetical protein